MINRPNTNAQRLKRHKRVRGKISGTPERPRLNVFRSETNIYAQIIDDVNGHTLAAASSLEKDFQCDGDKKAAAKLVGQKVAERAKAKGIDTVVSRLWPRAPVRAACSSNQEEERICRDLKNRPANISKNWSISTASARPLRAAVS